MSHIPTEKRLSAEGSGGGRTGALQACTRLVRLTPAMTSHTTPETVYLWEAGKWHPCPDERRGIQFMWRFQRRRAASRTGACHLASALVPTPRKDTLRAPLSRITFVAVQRLDDHGRGINLQLISGARGARSCSVIS